jgi:mono/diheme cytochrome c family protein
MWRAGVAFLSSICLVCVVSAQDAPKDKNAQEAAPASDKVPAEAAKRANPVKLSSASIADGKHLYESQCLMCHGKDGDGKGELAVDMKLNLRDFRDSATFKDSTDGELFYVITKGKGDMPGSEDRLSETQRWNLINYIRSLASKTPPAKPKDDKPKDTKPQS